jgi:tetratricopeptide (TPR) repeat protein
VKNTKRLGILVLWIVLALASFLVFLWFQEGNVHFQEYSWGRFYSDFKQISLENPFGAIAVGLVMAVFSQLINSWIFPDRVKKEIRERVTKSQENLGVLEEQTTQIKSDVTQLIDLVNQALPEGLTIKSVRIYMEMLAPFHDRSEVIKRLDGLIDKELIEGVYRDILIVVIDLRFERSQELTDEVRSLKEQGNFLAAEILGEAQEYYKEGQAGQIAGSWFRYRDQQQSEDVRVLEGLIEMTISSFAYEEAVMLMKELVRLQPDPENYFELAYYLDFLNDKQEAQRYYMGALERFRELDNKQPGEYTLRISTTLNNLGNLYCDTNQFDSAADCFRESLSIRRKAAASDPSYLEDVAQTLNNLGILYQTIKDYGQSFDSYEECLSILRELEQENPGFYARDIARTLNNLGVLSYELRELDAAGTYYEEALRIRRLLAEQSPRDYAYAVAQTLNNLGLVYLDLDRVEEALECHSEALSIRKELADDNPRTYNPEVAKSLNVIGNIYLHMGENQQAVEFYEESLYLYEQMSPEGRELHLADMAMTLNNLGIAHQALNEYEEAEANYQQSLAIRRKLLGHGFRTYAPFVASTLYNLGILFQLMEENKQATGFFEEALELRKKLAMEVPIPYAEIYAVSLLECHGTVPMNTAVIEEAIGLLESLTEARDYESLIGELRLLLGD